MIQFEQVSKRYAGHIDALSQINFYLEQGEMAFLTGHSGAGKTTLLKLATGLEKQTSGKIVVNNTVLSNLSSRELSRFRSQLGFIFQTPDLLQDRSVFDNVALPLHIHGIESAMIAKRVSASLEMVGLLNKEKLYPQYLSTGEQQRIGIARAIVHKPALLLADEPTGNLDPILSTGVMKLFEQFNQFGMSILIVTHDLSLIAGMKYRIAMLKSGQLC